MNGVSAYSGSERSERCRRLRDTLEFGLNEREPVSKKAQEYFANMFSPLGSTQSVDPYGASASPRFSLKNIQQLCTYVLSEKKDTIRRIDNTYVEVAQLTVENTLTLKEKMSRISTYIGALIVVLKARVCHGDQKPANILWDDDHFVLSDFNGSILLDDVCNLMNKEFQLESQVYRDKLHVVVSAFYSKSKQLELVCKSNPVQVKKLEKWGILGSGREVIDEIKLSTLKAYLGTKYFPDHTKGYASEHYLKKMGDYFWQCDKANYIKAAQAFDIRAAGLTIYSILSQARCPRNEDDDSYYDTLVKSLGNLALPERAITLIRRMAKPSLPTFGREFSLPISLDELAELEKIFGSKQTVKSVDIPRIVYTESASFRSPGQLQTALNHVQDAIERLSLIEGDEEESVKLNVMENLIDALSNEDILTLVNKLPSHEKVDSHTRREIIQQAFDRYPTSCEMPLSVNGQTYTVLLLLDENNLHRSDVLLKKEIVGDGASAVIFQALSLRSLSYVVVKYFQELADPNEAEHAQTVLSHVGKHDGVQNVTQPYIIRTDEGDKKVVIDSFYKKRDYGAAVHGEILCARLGIPRERWGDASVVQTALRELNKGMLQVLFSNKTTTEKHRKVEEFFNDYGSTLIAILGIHKGKQLLEDYNSLITESPREPLKEDEEPRKSPRKFTVKDLLPFNLTTPKSPRASPRASPREPSSRRNSMDAGAQSLSWIDMGSDEPNKAADIDATIEAINVNALEQLMEDPNITLEHREEIVKNAQEITLRAIRKCQRLILYDCLLKQADPLQDVNPAVLVKSWQKQAKKIGENHLDIKGINHISKLVGVEVVVQPDEGISRQRTLGKLLDSKIRVEQMLAKYNCNI